MLIRYTKDRPGEAFRTPDAPLAAIRAVSLDAAREFIKPKMALAMLSAPIASRTNDEAYDLGGYGRLDDDDFAPIGPEPSDDGRIS
ncbi:MAG: hypothetical protein BGO49_27395 [Planctomycetales bacterium 71-10]|nr:MAG: hypothetical protein BGO49_27395 [Planctomycetales bacterium 71-10]